MEGARPGRRRAFSLPHRRPSHPRGRTPANSRHPGTLVRSSRITAKHQLRWGFRSIAGTPSWPSPSGSQPGREVPDDHRPHWVRFQAPVLSRQASRGRGVRYRCLIVRGRQSARPAACVRSCPDYRKPCLCSSDRLYLNVCIGLCIAGEKDSPSQRQGHGAHRGSSAVQVVDAVRAAPGRAGRVAPVRRPAVFGRLRQGDLYPVCPARELLAGRYARCGTQTPR